MSEVAQAPQLRFPEFNHDWSISTIGNLAKIDTGNRDTQDRVNSGKYPFYVRSNTVERINEYTFDGEAILTSGDGVGVGKNFHYVIGKFNYHQRVYSIHNFTNLTNGKFVYYYFADKFYRRVSRLSAKNSVDSVRMSMISDMPISIPTKPEQQKIAEFLTAVDNKIEQLSKKQALLGEYKKGLMQQIFSQAIRFKADDGSDFPDWEEKKLGGVVDNVGGTALEKYTNPKETHKFISIGNYGVDGKYIDNGQRVELNNKTKTKLLDKDNLVMVLNDKTAAGNIVGSTILIDESDSYIYNQRSERLICKSELFPIFAWHYLNSKIFRKSVYSISQGGTQIYVNFPSVKELNFSLPSLLEQTKIANFLSSIDTKIEQVGGQLDESKQFKKALLQQMFV